MKIPVKMGSRHFPESGMYLLRSGWKAESVYMAPHCSPAAATGHGQPDNGTFELYAGGRWLMPDSGVYAYPDTPHAAERDWSRQTAVHQTLTAGRRNSQNRPRHRLWASEPGFDCLAFENESYPVLVHRRSKPAKLSARDGELRAWIDASDSVTALRLVRRKP